MHQRNFIPALFIFLFLVTSCGGPDLPFQYQYTFADTVDVSINGTSYRIGKNMPPPANLPFQYSFESDGDLDITMAGTTYEIESPYDTDGSIKKKKKKSATTTKKSSSTKSSSSKKSK